MFVCILFCAILCQDLCVPLPLRGVVEMLQLTSCWQARLCTVSVRCFNVTSSAWCISMCIARLKFCFYCSHNDDPNERFSSRGRSQICFASCVSHHSYGRLPLVVDGLHCAASIRGGLCACCSAFHCLQVLSPSLCFPCQLQMNLRADSNAFQTKCARDPYVYITSLIAFQTKCVRAPYVFPSNQTAGSHPLLLVGGVRWLEPTTFPMLPQDGTG